MNFLRQCGPSDLSVIHIDTDLEFPEVQSYIQKMKKLWKLNLITVKCEGCINKITNENDCSCEHRKKEEFVKILSQKNYDCILIGDTSESDKSLSDVVVSHPELSSVIVKPLFQFTSNDIFDYIRINNLPRCSLYEKGYQKIDCVLCSRKNQVEENTLKQDDEEIIKEKLKKLGYL